jgi:hypothetical protein
MAFFMFLSGIVFYLKVKIPTSLKDYKDQVSRPFARLMPAYFLFAGVVFFSKLGAQSVMHVDNPVNSWSDLLNIFLFPMDSISAFLWYIYVLCMFCTATLTLLYFAGGRIFLIVVLGVPLLFLSGPTFLGIDMFCRYFLFFSLGGLAICNWDKYNIIVKRTWIIAMVVFIFMLISFSYQGKGWIPTALLSLIALHGLCKQNIQFVSILRFLGSMTFPIYLMNTLSIGFVKAVLLKFFSWDGVNFLFFVPILILAGLLIPVLIKQHIISRIGWIDKITS